MRIETEPANARPPGRCGFSGSCPVDMVFFLCGRLCMRVYAAFAQKMEMPFEPHT